MAKEKKLEAGKMTATGTAGVYKRQTAAGGIVFYIKYPDKDGKQVWEKMGAWSEGIREAFCKEQRSERLNLIRHGELPPALERRRKRHVLTFGQLADAYFEAVKDKPDTKNQRNRYDNSLRRFHHAPADSIRSEDITALLKAKEEEGKSLASLNHILTLARTIYRHAIGDKNSGYKEGDPTAGIKKRKVDNARQGFLSPDECRTLIDEVKKSGDQELLLFALISLNTGARVATVLAIRGIDCDLTHGVLRLQNLKSDRGYNAFITDELRPLLSKRIDELENPYHHLIGGGERPQNYRTPAKKLQPYLDRLFNEPKKIAKTDRKRRIVVHSLRHSFGSNLAMAGVSPLAIMRLLDHSSMTLTERYSKIAESGQRSAVADLMAGIMKGE